MKILITAGSTNVMIDQVRCISNIFKGATGSEIAREAFYLDHDVTLITSNTKYFGSDDIVRGINIIGYHTYDELLNRMETEIKNNKFDAIIHSAAVSDYKVEGTYEVRQTYQNFILDKLDSSKKLSSNSKELYLKLVPTEKIIDKIRTPWGFKGTLVKFKLQVGISDKELLDIATKSCADSNADFIVANCLEWSKERAYIADSDGFICSVTRENLPATLLSYLVGDSA